MYRFRIAGRALAGLATAVSAALFASVLTSVVAAPVLAHGSVSPEPPEPGSLFLGWTFHPLPALAIGAAMAWWLWAVRKVNARHPANPVPRVRTAAFVAAMAALAFALLSGIERYDTTLFAVHMVQHVLLVLVTAPLLALAAPLTLVLRLASRSTRRRWILPVLNSRAARALAFPVTTWVLFAGVMWASHFSPLFDVALEEPLVHDAEHLLFLSSALLFWWPAVAADPIPWRLGHPARIGYLFLQMTQNTFLAVVILNASSVLYAHYATLGSPYGIDPLADQHLAGGVMWLAGDAIFVVAIMVLLAGWMRAESRGLAHADRHAAVELAEIRVRERRLAERVARERGDHGRTAGPR